jgi:hypothetical protein
MDRKQFTKLLGELKCNGFHWDQLILSGRRDFKLSIQAGPHMYCSPRKTLDSLLKYSRVEIALMDPYERDPKGYAKWLTPEEVGIEMDWDSGDTVLSISLDDLFKAICVEDVEFLRIEEMERLSDEQREMANSTGKMFEKILGLIDIVQDTNKDTN